MAARKKNNDKIDSYEKIRQIVADEVKKNLDEFNEETLREEVRATVKRFKTKEILLQLGFRMDFGRLEVDRSNNGRSSAILGLITKYAKEELDNWFAGEFKQGLPKLTQETKNTILKEYHNTIHWEGRHIIQKYAKDNIEGWVKDALKGAVGPLVNKEFWDELEGKED